MEEVTAGLDIGTSSIKIVLYGKKGVYYSERINHSKGSSDGRELDPIKLLKDIIRLIHKVKDKNNDLKIKAIGISSLFPSFIALDKKGNPLTKIITWMDNRGNGIVVKFKKRKKETILLQKKTGCIVHESYTLWKILWLKKNEKEIYLKANKFLSLPDYLVYKLTGKFAVSYAIASTTGLFNINSLKWDKEILRTVGISESQLPECHNIYHSEKFLEEIRTKTGLDSDIVLVLGAGDGQLSNIGSGCLSDRIICSTIGTSAGLRITGDSQKFNKSVWKYYLYGKKYIYGIAINAGSSTLAWFYKNIFHKNPDNLFNGIDRIDLNRPTDIIVLPFLDGERGPHYNQNMSASLLGLSSRTTGNDIFKAVAEGIIFNLYHCYKILVKNRKRPKEIIATGGYIYSEKLLQMQADIFNVKVKVPYVKEASAVGAAIVSLIAIGEIASLSEVKTKFEKIYMPSVKKHKEYMIKYRKYRRCYEIYSKSIL